MKYTFLILLFIVSTANADTLDIGVARIKHFEARDSDTGLQYNEVNPFIMYNFNRWTVGAFQNSYKDVAPYISYDFYQCRCKHRVDVRMYAGIARYHQHGHGQPQITSNMVIDKRLNQHVTFELMVNPVYVGSALIIRFFR